MAENYVIISETDFQKARTKIRQISNLKNKIVFSGNDEINRKILEKEKIDVLLLNLKQRKDKIKQRDSGFNQVFAKLAKKKDVSIGINLDEIINSDKKQQTKIIGRLRQNIELCKKNKLKMVFFSNSQKKDKYDLFSLALVLGMPTWMIKQY